MKALPNESDYLKMLTESLDRYLRERYTLDHRNSGAYGSIGFSRDVHSEVCQLGVVEAMTSTEEDFGNQGNAIAKIFESLGYALVVEPILGNLILTHVLKAINESKHVPLLESLVEGSAVAAWAPREALNVDCETLPETTCQKVQGGWILNGTKILVRQGFSADWLLLSVRISEAQSSGPIESALAIVATDLPGLKSEPRPCLAGGTASDTSLNQVFIPEHCLIARSSAADGLMDNIQSIETLALCGESLGLMKSSIEATKAYLGTRNQFGRPLKEFQALQHRLADLDVEYFQAVGSVHRAAQLMEQGSSQVRDRALAAARYTVSRVGRIVAEDCIQLHGAIGMTWEAGISHYAKRLVMIEHEFGDETWSLSQYMQLSGY
ncbi:pimeloyl-CoA dehydrogenase small subunit [Achromobacter sp. K91]|uniref:acyl-CoA dehydrogenase n=1 Tax=Achromobacter sp. K91 TaxID=2292262 RepID=UPI000E670C0C|nr:acyl-CoA dehydrogenase [Achromobacter sp. K91]RIJ03240.1 pimeloyl-CoA dehydrogenase small subunit [Achromobacter sp. K91]